MARDLIHEAVKTSLIRDGWKVTNDPYKIELVEDGRYLEADLGAEKIIGLEKGTEKIIVEIKTFSRPSAIYQFHEALGQYLAYRVAIQEASIERDLYLAISTSTFDAIEQIKFISTLVNRFQLKMVIVDVVNKKVVKWIK
ncbi:MAG: element excision factor XisH family protein [Bacteroidota bacterium]